ncbi:anaphase-promoting complex subunit 5 [Myzus persicae]|uniref:anaphase-promoting complex subunit 5 n=1 Tax=Myzus persicae TaxID=13164 RepID=UPI000B93A07A|nr:anaphase-promoting complex subunit 5 [Myzus persicae]
MSTLDFTAVPNTSANEIQENVTTHNVLVLTIITHYIRDYAKRFPKSTDKPLDGVQTSKFHRTFSMLALHLIQCPDLTFGELINLISCGKYQLPQTFIQTFHLEVYHTINTNLNIIADMFKNLDGTFLDTGLPKVHQLKIVNGSSPVGIFIRRIMLFFNKMQFLQTEAVIKEVKTHCSTILNKIPGLKTKKVGANDKEELSPEAVEMIKITKTINDIIEMININYQASYNQNSKYNKARSWSPRQVELFIAQQVKLLKINESVALDPPTLHQKLKDILRANPDHFDVHYLNYLNCLRVKEYCGAVSSVQHYFSRQTFRVINVDEKSRGYQYTSLNMAILNAFFNHNEEAISYLKESIAVAHQVNDHVCLQHALMWMYTLSKKNKSTMLRCSVTRSKELQLHQITSFSLQSMAQYLVENSENPAIVFEILKKSEIYNYFNGLTDLRMTNNVQKAAIWNTYGYQRISTIHSLLVLEHDQCNKDVYNIESKCIAMCNIINDLIAHGDYYLAPILINEVSHIFPYTHSKFWIMAEQYLNFTLAMNKEEWPKAELAAKQMASVNVTESALRLGEMYLKKEDFVAATNIVKELMENNEENTVLTRLRAYLIVAKANESAALNLLMDAKLIAIEYHLMYMTAIINVEIAIVLMKYDFPHKALRLLQETKQHIYCGINVYDKAYTDLQIIKAKMMVNIVDEFDHSREFLNKMYDKLNKIAEKFRSIEAITELKEVIYLQALIADELDMKQNRNKHAMEFRHLEEYKVQQ